MAKSKTTPAAEPSPAATPPKPAPATAHGRCTCGGQTSAVAGGHQCVECGHLYRRHEYHAIGVAA